MSSGIAEGVCTGDEGVDVGITSGICCSRSQCSRWSSVVVVRRNMVVTTSSSLLFTTIRPPLPPPGEREREWRIHVRKQSSSSRKLIRNVAVELASWLSEPVGVMKQVPCVGGFRGSIGQVYSVIVGQ